MRVFCGLCRTDFSVAASGIYDVRAHAKGTHHKEKTADRGTMRSIQPLFTGQILFDLFEYEKIHNATGYLFNVCLIIRNVLWSLALAP